MLSRTARAAVSSSIRDLLDHARQPGVISLAGGLPAPELFPVTAVAEATAAVWEEWGSAALQYGPTRGEERMRAAAAALTPGAAAGDVLVTTGSQQALALLAQVLLEPADAVVVAEAEYPGALQCLRRSGARLVGLPMDRRGLRTDTLAAALVGGLRPKLCYVVPNFHNPTGATLAPERRRQLTRLAEHYGFLVVEDDPYGLLAFDGRTRPPIGPGSAQVVRVRTLSKVLAPGLRLGWVVAPAWLRDALEIAKQSQDMHTSTLSQALAHQLLADQDWLREHLGTLRRAYAQRCDALVGGLARACGDAVTVTVADGGMFLWAKAAGAVDTAALLPSALQHGVAYVPGAAFAVDRPLPSALRLCFATAAPGLLDEAAERLGGVLRHPAASRA